MTDSRNGWVALVTVLCMLAIYIFISRMRLRFTVNLESATQAPIRAVTGSKATTNGTILLTGQTDRSLIHIFVFFSNIDC